MKHLKLIQNISNFLFEQGRKAGEKKLNCKYCEDTGKRHIPNGRDDFDVEICDCPAGKMLDKGEDLAEELER